MIAMHWKRVLAASLKAVLPLVLACCAAGLPALAQDADIITAAQDGNLGRVKVLLAGGASVDAVNDKGGTALMVATQHGHQDVVQALLNKGAAINACDPDGESALSIASQRGHSEVVNMLLARGAEVDLADRDGWTPLSVSRWTVDIPGAATSVAPSPLSPAI